MPIVQKNKMSKTKKFLNKIGKGIVMKEHKKEKRVSFEDRLLSLRFKDSKEKSFLFGTKDKDEKKATVTS